MLKKTITYTDFNGEERTEDFYFNLTKAEIMEMEYESAGGMTAALEYMMNRRDADKIMATFKDFILRSYGEKSLDGKRFVKSKELSEAFAQTEAYSVLFMELLSDNNAATAFLQGIVPSDVAAKASELLAERESTLAGIPGPSDK